MRNCCICSSNVGTVGRTRCKLLNRPSCNGEKAYLEKIATKWLGVSLTDFKDIGQNPDATVCYCCLQKLTKCDKFEQDLHKFTQELVQHLRKLSVVRTDKGSQERPKRSVSKSAERRASKLQRIERQVPVHEQASQLGGSSDTESLPDDESDEDNSNVASPDVQVCSYM